jgi:GAF domain-containing protein
LPPHPGLWADVRATGRPARVESYTDLDHTISAELAGGGIHGGVGVPIIVGGATWGVISALSTEERPLPDGVEGRLVGFTELLRTAIANKRRHETISVDSPTNRRRSGGWPFSLPRVRP